MSVSKLSRGGESGGDGLVFRVAKVDAGIAILISDSVHLIEFPSLLLPAGVGPGSIVNIACTRNVVAEKAAVSEFWDLQEAIFQQFGQEEPKAPELRVRNTTQTSVTLEWDKLELEQAKLLELAIWRNGARLTTIPNPLNNTSTKLSGLAVDTAYTFHLVLKSTAGTYSSPIAKVRTHNITNCTGISVCFGLVEPSLLAESKAALNAMGSKYSDKIQIDTTHFVCTSPASPANPSGGPSVEYQKAVSLSIPVVAPAWVLSCKTEKKLVPIANFYSVGVINNSLSISSSQLATTAGPSTASNPSGGARTLLQQKPVRRATATTTATSPEIVITPMSPTTPTEESREVTPEAPPVPTHDEVVESPSSKEAEVVKQEEASDLDDLVAGKDSVPDDLAKEDEESKKVKDSEAADDGLVEIGL